MNTNSAPSPCYIIDLGQLQKNLAVLKHVQDEAGCKIILALKGYAAFSTFPLIKKYLAGTTASSVNEALLGHHEFGGEVHVYAPAYSLADIKALTPIAHHISFNSIAQYNQFSEQVKKADHSIQCGLRINPEYSEVEVALYDPCAPNSRLGVTANNLESVNLEGITGLHFHTLCEQNSDTLARTLDVVEEKFGHWFDQLSWINFGGGHHITQEDYDVDLL
ncbi:MAG: carboxynorspermidine decarboxylase, partial [Verrucomicrobia bacterium]|nr:carboxynorspermidine decarboxylase [Verrucomicrobiota bacterium]